MTWRHAELSRKRVSPRALPLHRGFDGVSMLAERLDRLVEIEPQPFPVLSLYLDTTPNETGHRTVQVL